MKIKGKGIGIIFILTAVITVIIFSYIRKNVVQENKSQMAYKIMQQKMKLENEFITEVDFEKDMNQYSLEINNLLIQTNQVIIAYSILNSHDIQLHMEGLSVSTDNNYTIMSSEVISNVNKGDVMNQIAIFTFEEDIPTNIIGKNIQFSLEIGEYSKTEGEIDSSLVMFETNVKNIFEPKLVELNQPPIKLGDLLVQVNSIKLSSLYAEINYTTSEPISNDKLVLFTITNEQGDEMPEFTGEIGATEGTMYFVITTEDTTTFSVTPQLLSIQEDSIEIIGDTQLIELD